MIQIAPPHHPNRPQLLVHSSQAHPLFISLIVLLWPSALRDMHFIALASSLLPLSSPATRLFLHLVTRPPLAPLRGTPRGAPIPIFFHSKRHGSLVHSVDGGEVAWSTPSGHLAILPI